MSTPARNHYLEAKPAWMASRLHALEKRGLLRETQVVEEGTEPWLTIQGRRYLNLSSNNYLGLSNTAAVKSAVASAAQEYGAGSGAARLITGTHPLHESLENRLAHFKCQEAALLYNSGYTANLGVVPSLVGPRDIVIGDALNHASLIDGCRLSGAEFMTYPHRDMCALEDLFKGLENQRRSRRLVVTDTVFSMDGDIAPLSDLVEMCERHDAMLMVDEAHATGCLGPGGRGVAALLGVQERICVNMGTLSKALGSFGAFVVGTGLLRDYLINTSRSFMFSTSLPVPVVAASLAALGILEGEAELPCRLQENGAYLRQGLGHLGFNTLGSETHIVPVLVGESQRALEFARLLREEGIYAVAVRPPTVPPGQSRVRASVMATHTRQDLNDALDAFERAGRAVGLA